MSSLYFNSYSPLLRYKAIWSATFTRRPQYHTYCIGPTEVKKRLNVEEILRKILRIKQYFDVKLEYKISDLKNLHEIGLAHKHARRWQTERLGVNRVSVTITSA